LTKVWHVESSIVALWLRDNGKTRLSGNPAIDRGQGLARGSMSAAVAAGESLTEARRCGGGTAAREHARGGGGDWLF
jgi:hypothetical protein